MRLSHVIVALSFAIALVRSTPSTAGDYVVAYAFDATTAEDVSADRVGSRNEHGAVRDCRYGAYCAITLPKSDLLISFSISGPDQKEVRIAATRGRGYSLTCCYFSDGEHGAWRTLTSSMLRLWIFEGRPRKRNEYVQNLPVGLLYLRFFDLK
jgi:hypothetical protein